MRCDCSKHMSAEYTWLREYSLCEHQLWGLFFQTAQEFCYRWANKAMRSKNYLLISVIIPLLCFIRGKRVGTAFDQNLFKNWQKLLESNYAKSPGAIASSQCSFSNTMDYVSPKSSRVLDLKKTEWNFNCITFLTNPESQTVLEKVI